MSENAQHQEKTIALLDKAEDGYVISDLWQVTPLTSVALPQSRGLMSWDAVVFMVPRLARLLYSEQDRQTARDILESDQSLLSLVAWLGVSIGPNIDAEAMAPMGVALKQATAQYLDEQGYTHGLSVSISIELDGAP